MLRAKLDPAGLGSPVDTHDGYQDFDAPMLRTAAGGACIRNGVDLHTASVITYAANAPTNDERPESA